MTETGDLDTIAKSLGCYVEAKQAFSHLSMKQVQLLVDLRHLPGVRDGDTFIWRTGQVSVLLDYNMASSFDGRNTRSYVHTVHASIKTFKSLLRHDLAEELTLYPGLNRWRLAASVYTKLPFHHDHPDLTKWSEASGRISTADTCPTPANCG